MRIALLLLVVALAPAQQTCGVCADEAGAATHTVRCPTCAGKGQVKEPCAACRRGKIPCHHCHKIRDKAEGDGIVIKKRGHVPCTNPGCNKKGKVLRRGMKPARCHYCRGKGALKCPYCKGRDAITCGVCFGETRKLKPCIDCVGVGKLPCPGCAVKPTAQHCVLCKDVGLRTCGVCTGKNTGEAHCHRCHGEGTRACDGCLALVREPCDVCQGTGTMRTSDARGRQRTGTRKCDHCAGKGHEKCGHCKKGRVDCEWCEAGKVKDACGACPLDGRTFCANCLSGRARLTILYVRLLIDRKHPELSHPWIDAAVRRSSRMRAHLPYKARLEADPDKDHLMARLADVFRRVWPPEARKGGPHGPNELIEEHREDVRKLMEGLRPGRKK